MGWWLKNSTSCRWGVLYNLQSHARSKAVLSGEWHQKSLNNSKKLSGIGIWLSGQDLKNKINGKGEIGRVGLDCGSS